MLRRRLALVPAIERLPNKRGRNGNGPDCACKQQIKINMRRAMPRARGVGGDGLRDASHTTCAAVLLHRDEGAKDQERIGENAEVAVYVKVLLGVVELEQPQDVHRERAVAGAKLHQVARNTLI